MQAPWYSINKTAQWDGTGATASPQTPWDKGYGVIAPMAKYHDKSHDARNDLYHLANGQLNNGSYQWPLFITDVAIDFSVSGHTAQSRLTRDFYPHNFVQPAFQITGQALDEWDYGMMCDFVHMCQQSMLKNFTDNGLMQLQIANRGIPGGQTKGLAVTTTNGNATTTNYNQSIHGPHQEILAKGVVTTMPRQHQTGVPAPTWSFGFQVYQMQGPYAEGAAQQPPHGKTWVDLLKGAQNIDTKPLVTQNKSVLNWVAKNSKNVVN